MCTRHRQKHRQKGISLIELIMFIVIVSVGIAGILSVMNVTTKNSADPLIRKQALAIAESMLEEIALQPFTYCDPDDANALTATGVADCAGVPGIANEDALPAAARVSAVAQRNAANVADYNNFSMTPIRDISGTAIAGLDAYSVSVAINQVGDTFVPAVAKNDVLQVDVTVVSGNTDITVTAYRFRYAPNAVP
ncbi:MAG: prepilin-type N-terminal cleavage/methylation domain-containing protein [Oxalobacteraceae bacterium]